MTGTEKTTHHRQGILGETDPLLTGLNKEQEEAVIHNDGPLLIVAGAGTGKTTVITRRIAYLVKMNRARLDEIAAMTFTEKAAGEMEERVDLLMPTGYTDTWIHTFHGFCERILKTHAIDIGLPGDFEILDETGQWILLHDNLDSFNLDYYRPLGNPTKFIDSLLSHFSRLKDEVITPEEYLNYAEKLRLSTDNPEGVGKKIQASASETPTDSRANSPEETISEIARIQELANAYHTYQKTLLRRGYLDFGDLINYTITLFEKRPKILSHYQNKFKYVLVDEFQDTNFAQYKLIQLLAGNKKNLTVVGDDDQSIYKFRGASVSNILKFKEDFPEVKQITLAQNYRSGQNILDLAYRFIQANNPDRLEVKLKIDKRLKAGTNDRQGAKDGMIEVMEAQDLSGELNAVMEKILELKQSSNDSWNDFAILMRSNSAADELLPLLHNKSIPYTYVASRGLYKKPVIVDLLSYLRLLDNAHDSKALYRVLQLPKFKISHDDLSELLRHGHKKALSLYESIRSNAQLNSISQETRKKINTLAAAISNHSQSIGRLNAAELFVQVVRDLGMEDMVKEETATAAENRELIEQFYKKIEVFEQKNQDKSMHAFLDYLNLELSAGNEGQLLQNPDNGPESVKVMTVHGSKGLEFKHVFVINMVDQRFPTRQKPESIEIPAPLIKDILPEGDFHLQEERRLFYVAITRAKTNLFFSWAKDYGGARAKKPSVFLVESGLVPGEKVSKATGTVLFNKVGKNTATASTMECYIPATKFSYSQLSDFETCALKYKYQYLLKLPVEGSCHLSFGQTIHKVFEEFLKRYKANRELPQQDLFGGKPEQTLPEFSFLERLYEKHWVDDWYKTKREKEEYRKRGKQYLTLFYESLKNADPTPKYIEQFFKLKVGMYDFVGKIDRADAGSSGIVIWDYKTGKAPKKQEGKDLDQLYIYQWAAEEFLKEKVGGLRYWYLQENQVIEESIASEAGIKALKQKLLEKIETIVTATRHNLFSEIHKKNKNHTCEFEHLE